MERRTLLAGMGALFLTACARARGPRPRHVENGPRAAHVVDGRCRQDGGAVLRAPVHADRSGRRGSYRIVSRAMWGAESLKDNHDPMARIRRITLHHTASVPESGPAEARAPGGEPMDRELVLGVQNFHRNTRGWADIGYHWLIGRDGNVYEGRALDVQGAHAGGGNNVENLGISVIGDFTATLPAPRQLATVDHFLRAQMRRYSVPAAEVFGHRDFKPTECPGGALYAWLENFKRGEA